jgi:sortase system peptidoglycan-associated protein
MKKSLLHITVSAVLTGAILSTSVISSQTYASEYIVTDDDSSNNEATETYMLPGMSAGAVTGAVIAGPVGVLIGGIIGAVAGSSQQVIEQPDLAINDINNSAAVIEPADLTERHPNLTDDDSEPGIQLAQLGSMNSIIEDQDDSPQEKLMNILVTDLSLDVYFRSGSADIEKFYPARLSAIADLINSMDKLELHLDGYTDRRGDKSQNIALANERVEKVRRQLIDAGVDENRIISKAFGEVKMVSAAGDLDAYTFDRKVVIRFERADKNSISSMATVLSGIETDTETETKHEPLAVDVSSRF